MIISKSQKVPEIELNFLAEFTRKMNNHFLNKDRKNKLNKLNGKK